MDKIILENFRCFKSNHEVPIAPLTLLVGENSTGKSSFLAAIRIAWDIGTGQWDVNFNEFPFQLGSFKEIQYSDISEGEDSLRIGFSLINKEEETKGDELKIIGAFEKRGAEPKLADITWKHPSLSLKIKEEQKDNQEQNSGFRTFTIGLETQNVDFEASFVIPKSIKGLWPIWDYIKKELLQDVDRDSYEPDFSYLETLNKLVKESLYSRPYAIGPIRTKPKRTYDYWGDPLEIPDDKPHSLLARTRISGAWLDLEYKLSLYGEKGSLFKEIDVKLLGEPLSDPYQIRVKVSDKFYNIVDVGYGVSQVLPILVNSLIGINQIFLIQQPEIHLHPRAQAELGTMFGMLAGAGGQRFFLETHSDALIDRIRLEIREKRYGFIGPEDVIILYFQHQEDGVKIYPIRIDSEGNLVGVPDGYRSFFLEEEKRFFGV